MSTAADPTTELHQRFLDGVRQPLAEDPGIDPADAQLLLELFDAQLTSRHADLAARAMRARGIGYYTISSAGHEGNAAVAAATRTTDPALLHYRSGAFYAHRSAAAGRTDALQDILFGVVGAAAEPISQGRHKVFGRAELAVIPQTSTIASQLPRAVGVGFAIGRAAKLGIPTPWGENAVAVCSFGDASLNHSTATGAINAAIQVGYRGLPMPVLFVCEDNGLGISVPTPPGWVAHAVGDRAGLGYVAADGLNLPQALRAARTAVDRVRRERRPVLLHLRTVRLLGHAGSDVESAYRSPARIAADLALDPVVDTARRLVAGGLLTVEQAVDRYRFIWAAAQEVARRAAGEPQLPSAAAVMRPLTTTRPVQVAALATVAAPDSVRHQVFNGRLPEHEGPLTLAQQLGRGLTDLLAGYPQALLFGEDVAVKGGVYGVTRGLQRALGRARVFDTLLDEQTILGLALGAGVSGLLPIPEIQYLAYLHNAIDQLRGEGASQSFFSAGQYTNPMVVRIAGLAYQKGFGGHFHNDHSVAALRDIPGLLLAVPAFPADAPALLRTAAAAALAEGRVSVILEPIALYHTKDLHRDGDRGWLQGYCEPERWAAEHLAVGRARTHRAGTDLTIATFGNGLWMSLRVAERLAAQGISAGVMDLRWLAPLPVTDVLDAAGSTGRLLVVDETRTTAGVAESLIARVVLAGFTGRVAAVAAPDSYIPLGDSAAHVLVSEDDIERAAMELLQRQ